MNGNTRNRRLLSVAVIALMLASPAFVVMADDEQVEPADAGLLDNGFNLVEFLQLPFFYGGIGLALIWEMNSGGGDDDQARSTEAQLIMQAWTQNIPLYANAYEQNASTWSLTSEHWERQAELAAASLWELDSLYDANSVLNAANLYYNQCVMMTNTVAQLNEQLDMINEHVQQWNGSDVAQYYGDGKMRMQFSFEGNSVSATSADQFTARMGSVIRDVQSGTSVFYAGGDVYVTGAARLVGEDGYVVELNKGWNFLESAETFEHPGIYTFQTSGITMFNTSMWPVVTTNTVTSAHVDVGFAVSCADDYLIVSYDTGTGQITDGKTKGSINDTDLMIEIVAQGVGTQGQSLNDIIFEYGEVKTSVQRSQDNANLAAMTVWDIYNDAGYASAYLTTLVVPTTYQNVTFNEAQKRALTILAMEQLTDFWDKSSQSIKDADFQMTLDSMSLFCRGSITIPGHEGSEEKYYDDVIFTPIFYQQETLKTGIANSIDQYGFIIIWCDGKSLASFDNEKDDAYLDLVFVPEGSDLEITEMRHEGEMVSEVTLEPTEVPWIDPREMEDWDPYDPQYNDMGELLRLVLVLGGAAIALLGVASKNIYGIVIGIAIMAVGFLFANVIANFLDTWFGWTFRWPFR